MTPARTAAYVGGGIVLVAWFASAAGVPRQPRIIRVPTSSGTVALGGIVSDVQSQASRLRQRLAAAPAPQLPLRNPFAFGARDLPRRHDAVRVAPVPSAVPAAPAVAAPLLTLLGIAEQKTDTGRIRTAMFSDPGGQLVMAVEGQEIAGRYRVLGVGPDAVELQDLLDGSTRRLALK
jgi:hypothetical protein